MSLADGTATVTTEGPWRPGRLEWPRIPGEDWPRDVVVNGQPWGLRYEQDRLTAAPGGPGPP
jgi:hypothetical protein